MEDSPPNTEIPDYLLTIKSLNFSWICGYIMLSQHGIVFPWCPNNVDHFYLFLILKYSFMNDLSVTLTIFKYYFLINLQEFFMHSDSESFTSYMFILPVFLSFSFILWCIWLIEILNSMDLNESVLSTS